MRSELKDKVDIEKIIKNEHITICFQPIISIRKNSMAAFEALCRGIDGEEIIPPNVLFDCARDKDLTLELDRLCRKKALEEFASMTKSSEDMLLFLNFDASVIDRGVVGSGNLHDAVSYLNLNPSNIVIEINEAKTNNTRALTAFIDTYKNYGFIVALDDIGSGYSNLNRLAVVKPDILKIDMALISGIDKEFYKQEVVKSMVELARKIGALVVAEGVETQEEAINSLDLGVDMLQGYYFARPQNMRSIDFEGLRQKRSKLTGVFKQYILTKLKTERDKKDYFARTASQVAKELSKVCSCSFDEILTHIAHSYCHVECIYILYKTGIQFSETVCSFTSFSSRKKSIFYPAAKGTDHSLKDYYYLAVGNGQGGFVTEPYVSIATGSLCVTISETFTNVEGDEFVLCIDNVINDT